MQKTLKLTNQDRTSGSYLRKDVKKDVLYNSLRYKAVNMTFSKKTGNTTRITDGLAERMCKDGLITPETKEAYENRIYQAFSQIGQYDSLAVEDIYRDVHKVRKEILGAAALEQARENKRRKGAAFEIRDGIDQRQKKEELLKKCGAVIFVLCQPELLELMQADLAAAEGKEIFVLCSAQPGNELPTRQTLGSWLGDTAGVRFLEADENGTVAWDEALQKRIDGKQACLLFYGEEGLLHCRSLLVDAVVSAIPVGYHAQAVVNQLGMTRACVVYVPKGFDITRWVRLTERTRLSYWQLARLWEAYGDTVYACTPEELYRKYPQYFLNIYENGTDCPEAKEDCPVRVALPQTEAPVMEQYDRCRDQAIKEYLDGFENITYYSTYFDENLEEKPICWDSSEKQKGILVQGVRVKKAQGSRIVQCGKKTTLRQKFARDGIAETAIMSNFLFFLTPKLGVLYNDLRKDRPMEQADAAAGHLDYMLCYRDGKRIETFPLFRKTCIAMKENGEFLFFNFRLGGGRVCLGGTQLRWEKADVDARDLHGPVQVFTPYYSLPDRDADRQTYRTFVGENRVNLVILQDKLCSLRRGDVILPSVGVVISLEEKLGQSFIDNLGLKAMEDGYYDVSGLDMTVELDKPDQVDADVWKQVKWAYGGGLSLILDGVGLCDGTHMEQWFEEEGWMSPLSRQTQESALHTLVKHPRTAIGTTENGELVILVFSGRTWRSTGADYSEMCRIARKLFPDIRCLMNVDGGGSAVLGMIWNGNFMELSCPSTSTGSCVGMVRPVNTVLYIPAGERK